MPFYFLIYALIGHHVIIGSISVIIGLISSFETNHRGIKCVDVSDHFIATGGGEGNVQIWDRESGVPRFVCLGV